MGELWQLSRQSLLTDARRTGLHIARFGLCFVLYLSVVAATFEDQVTAAGLPLFHAQLLITSFYVSASAIFGFSQTITEEKEDGTLGLLRLAGISPLAILFGKSVGRLTDAAFTIAIQIPFSIVAITLGGVSLAQMSAAYGALLAYLWLLSAVGVTCSVLARTGGQAACWTAIFVVLYALPPFVWMLGVWQPPGAGTLYSWISLPQRIHAVTQSGFAGSVACWPITVALCAGAAGLIISWILFDRYALSDPSVAVVKPAPKSRFTRRLAWERPILGRDFLFTMGGFPWLLARLCVHLMIALAMVGAMRMTGQGFAWAGLVGGLFSVFDATWSAGNLFRLEIRDQTWSALVQTPREISHIVNEKCCAFLLGLTPSVILPFFWIFMAIIFHPHLGLEDSGELIIGSITIGLSVIAYLHLLVLLTLHFGWQATPLALTACFAAGWVYVVAFVPWRGPGETRCAMFVMTCFVLCGIMYALRQKILVKLRDLAATA